MREAFAMKDRLVFVDVYVDQFEHVYPMLIANQSMRDMWLSKTDDIVLIMRHIISVLIENEAGALSRLSVLFSQRGYNIETTVAPTDDATLSRLTLTHRVTTIKLSKSPNNSIN